jgi:hypothetical protein
MKKIFCCLLLSSVLASAQNVRQRLLVAHGEVSASKPGEFKQRIFAYNFLNGTYTGREEVMSFEGKKFGKDYIRADKGVNKIYKERYLITGIGNVIDLVDKTILFDGRAQLLFLRNDSAIYYTNDAFKGKFYSVFDFKKNEYTEVKNLLFKPKLGTDVEFDKTSVPYKINYYPQGRSKIELVADAGYGQQFLREAKYIPDPATYWIDGQRFIFTHLNKENTELSLFIVNLKNNSSKLISKNTVSPEGSEAWFERPTEDILVLHYGGTQVLVDMEKFQSRIADQTTPVHGFSFATSADQKGRIIKLYGKEIGKFQFDPENFVAGENIAGTVKVLMVGTDLYQQGLQVYNQPRNTWDQIDAEDVLAIIGWWKN